MKMRIQLVLIFLLMLSACKKPDVQTEPRAPKFVIIYYKLPPAWIKSDGTTEQLTINDLKKAGVDFAVGAGLLRGGPTGFGMKNTLSNHEKFKVLLKARYGGNWYEYKAPD